MKEVLPVQFGKGFCIDGIECTYNCYFIKEKVKLSCPATRHGGTWGEMRYSNYSYLTSALDGGEWSASCPGRALPPRKGPPYTLDRRLGGPQSRYGRRG
jgi:hypothetical protein